MTPTRIELGSGSGYVVVADFDRETFALDVGSLTATEGFRVVFRIVNVTDVELADLAIALANIPIVKGIIADAVALDRARRPEKYR